MKSAGNEKDEVAETRYRFVVKSADEAARAIRDKLGENARVLSVRQLEGSGLAGFLKAPRLEVIAEASDVFATTGSNIAATNQNTDKESITDLEKKREKAPPNFEAEETSSKPDLAAVRGSVVSAETHPTDQQLERILRKAGFSTGVLARLRTDRRWEQLHYRSLGGALIGVSEILRSEWTRRPSRRSGGRIAFLEHLAPGRRQRCASGLL